MSRSKRSFTRLLSLVLVLSVIGIPTPGGADESQAELAKKLNNPIAALISVPMQLNYDQNFGADDQGERWVLNVQPVIPFSLNEEWNLISRTILPLMWQDDIVPGTDQAGDFGELTKYAEKSGIHQALNIPSNTGIPVQYAGSTTGPGYNEKGSPFQVAWSVRPKVAKVDIESLGKWCKGNVFEEDHAHGVRNLVMNPSLLSKITR